MDAETRRKVEEMVLDILKKSNHEVATEFTIRLAASERLGIDLSCPEAKQFVRTVLESYLLSIAADNKLPPQELPHQPQQKLPQQPPPVPTEFARVKRRNDNSEHVICQLSSRRSVVVGDFKGTKLVSIREFYLKDGKRLFTQKGISLSSEQWSTFKNSVPAIEEAITKLKGRIRKNGEVSSSVVDVPVGPVQIEPVPVEPVRIEPVPIEPVRIEPVPIEIVRFDGKNYHVWAEQMELFLKQLQINYVLTEPCPNASLGDGEITETKVSEKTWLNDDLMCRRNILSHLSDSLFNKHANRKMSAKELWEELKFVYLSEESGAKISQVKKYTEFQMVDGKAVIDQIEELNNIADSIAAAGVHVEEKFHVSVIISKLPPSWKDFCMQLMGEAHLPFPKLMERVRKEQECRNGIKQMSDPPSKGGDRGVDIKPPPGFHRKFEPNVKNTVCYSCGDKGHISKNCWKRQ